MHNRLVENLFFFGILGFSFYVMFQIVQPFATPLVLAGILATVCYPVYRRCIRFAPWNNHSIASVLSVMFVLLIIVLPLSLILYLLVQEALAFYSSINSASYITINEFATQIENIIQNVSPGFTFNLPEYARQGAEWFAQNVGVIFATTASTILALFVAVIGLFYSFRDGKEFTKKLIQLSPLSNDEDEIILTKLARAIRSVVLGTLAVAFVQGVVAAIGFTIFGLSQPILLGSATAFAALIPAVGTSTVFIPTVLYLIYVGSFGPAIGLTIWWLFAVALIDNFLGPYLVGKGATLHPFLVLISVLGGVSFFGPLGFILGPVTLSFFMVMLELYTNHMNERGNGIKQKNNHES